MRHILLYILFFSLLAVNSLQAQQQKLPAFVQQRLDSVKNKTSKTLKDFRFVQTEINWFECLPYLLSNVFSRQEQQIIDSLGLNLSLGMVYDNESRKRMIQLMRDEYREDELDTIVNRQIGYRMDRLKIGAMKICKFDTMQVFKTTLDSFYIEVKNQNPNDSILRKYEYLRKQDYKYDVFKLLKLDTVLIYKETLQKIIEQAKIDERKDYLTNDRTQLNMRWFRLICENIGDIRFKNLLIELYNNAAYKDGYYKSLIKLKVEPYYSEFAKKRFLTAEQINDTTTYQPFLLDDLVYFVGTQKAFLEISKYLLSGKRYYGSEIPPDYVATIAFYLLRDNIQNKDFQAIIKDNDDGCVQRYSMQMYDWMRKNYGKYKIKRIW